MDSHLTEILFAKCEKKYVNETSLSCKLGNQIPPANPISKSLGEEVSLISHKIANTGRPPNLRNPTGEKHRRST